MVVKQLSLGLVIVFGFVFIVYFYPFSSSSISDSSVCLTHGNRTACVGDMDYAQIEGLIQYNKMMQIQTSPIIDCASDVLVCEVQQ